MATPKLGLVDKLSEISLAAYMYMYVYIAEYMIVPKA